MLLRVGPRWVLPARPVGTPEPYRVNPRSSGQPALRDRRPSLSSPLPAESQTVRSGTDFVLGTSVRANEAGLSIWSNGDCESNQTDQDRVPSGDHLTRSFFWDIGCDSKEPKAGCRSRWSTRALLHLDVHVVATKLVDIVVEVLQQVSRGRHGANVGALCTGSPSARKGNSRDWPRLVRSRDAKGDRAQRVDEASSGAKGQRARL
jgi:hypothetical protein